MRVKNNKKLPTNPTLLIAKQILLTFVDAYRAAIPVFDKSHAYRIPFKMYDKFREANKERFWQELYRLKKNRFVKKYFDGRDYYLELLPKGKKRIKNYLFEDLEVKSPKKWDKKWRLVGYDIPELKKGEREVIKRKLEELGFYKLQESLYVYPFECFDEVTFIKEMYILGPHVQYILADRVETEVDLINIFYDRGILTKRML